MLEAVVQDDGGKGDLTDEQWEKLQPFLTHENIGQDNQQRTIDDG